MENIEGKYFIDEDKYNCPFCKNRGIKYVVLGVVKFNEKKDKYIYAVFVECSYCHNVSLHLIKKDSFLSFVSKSAYGNYNYNFCLLNNDCKEFKTYTNRTKNYDTNFELTKYKDNSEDKIVPICRDEDIILHIPTSFFTIDSRIPKKFRELIEEAEKCIQNNCLTGASACIRKTIYEFLLYEKASGNNYDDKIKSLKGKYKSLDDRYLDMLTGIQGITCDQVHEATIYEKFSSQQAKVYIEIIKVIFNHFYVMPQDTAIQKNKIDSLYAAIKSKK